LVSASTKWHQLEEYSFKQYISEFKKVYSTVEEMEFRKSIFEASLESIKEHNSNPNFSWKEGVNHLTDRTEEEFNKLLGYRKDLAYATKANRKPRKEDIILSLPNPNLPVTVDWRTKGVVTAVKDQGMCGSCWSFGTAETLESFGAIANGELADLSEQQVLDCTPNPNQCGGTGGCQGGTVEIAFTQIMKTGGLSSEWVYPYVSYFGTNFPCRSNQTVPIVDLSSYVDLPPNQLQPLLNAIATLGPMAISVDASTWSRYESGVFDGCNQTQPDIDHSVQLVGYGTDSKFGDYWLVRNSWSPSWGEEGYIRLRRTATPRCGIDTTPSDGTGCKGGPPTVEVCGTCGILYDTVYPVITSKKH